MDSLNNTDLIEKLAFVGLLKEITDERNEDIRDFPDFLRWDWNDISILKNNSTAFFSILAYNSLYPNPVINEKLKSSTYLSGVVKWSIGLDPMVKELEYLSIKYPKLNLQAFAYYCFAFISLRVQKVILLAISDNKSEANYVPVLQKYFLQSRRSPKKTIKGTQNVIKLGLAFKKGIENNDTKERLTNFLGNEENPVNSLMEMTMQTQVASLTAYKGRKAAMKQLIGAIDLDSYAWMRLLPIEELEETYNKSELYRDLYGLFKLILKDKTLLSEEEHKKDLPDRYYNIYMVNQVKIILGRTRSKAKNQN